MQVYKAARDNAAADATLQIAESRARSALAGLPDSAGERVAAALVIKLRRLPDSLGADAGRTTALNASSDVRTDVSNKNPWNARGAAVAGSLTRRGKHDKRTRVDRLDAAHTTRHERIHALNVDLVRLHTLYAYHDRGGPKPSAKKRKRAQYQIHGAQAELLDLGASVSAPDAIVSAPYQAPAAPVQGPRMPVRFHGAMADRDAT